MTFSDEHFLNAAAESTLQSCHLLGTRSIGVDYGLVRTGIAFTIGYNPQPLVITSNLNTTQLCLKIINYCSSERAQQVIVGLPLHKNGTEAIQSQRTRAFCTELACLVLAKLGPDDIPIYLWDERFTSKEAAARRDTQFRKYDFETLDAHAACIILETYYAENGKGAERVHVPEDMKQVCWQAWNLQQEETRPRRTIDYTSRREQRQKAMERARKMEETLFLQGNKKKKKKKKKRK
jgi:putative Holliday junction resolvase